MRSNELKMEFSKANEALQNKMSNFKKLLEDRSLEIDHSVNKLEIEYLELQSSGCKN